MKNLKVIEPNKKLQEKGITYNLFEDLEKHAHINWPIMKFAQWFAHNRQILPNGHYASEDNQCHILYQDAESSIETYVIYDHKDGILKIDLNKNVWTKYGFEFCLFFILTEVSAFHLKKNDAYCGTYRTDYTSHKSVFGIGSKEFRDKLAIAWHLIVMYCINIYTENKIDAIKQFGIDWASRYENGKEKSEDAYPYNYLIGHLQCIHNLSLKQAYILCSMVNNACFLMETTDYRSTGKGIDRQITLMDDNGNEFMDIRKKELQVMDDRGLFISSNQTKCADVDQTKYIVPEYMGLIINRSCIAKAAQYMELHNLQ